MTPSQLSEIKKALERREIPRAAVVRKVLPELVSDYEKAHVRIEKLRGQQKKPDGMREEK